MNPALIQPADVASGTFFLLLIAMAASTVLLIIEVVGYRLGGSFPLLLPASLPSSAQSTI